jgi:hypothetical protein
LLDRPSGLDAAPLEMLADSRSVDPEVTGQLAGRRTRLLGRDQLVDLVRP